VQARSKAVMSNADARGGMSLPKIANIIDSLCQSP